MYINTATGFSKAVLISELESIHHSFHTTNGGDWCRSNQSYLGKKYYIVRNHYKNSIYSVKADGINKGTTINQNIRSDIQKKITSKRCAILCVSNQIECDHKEGMKDEWRLNDISKQKEEDFQPLSKAANDAKRSHCKRCKQTGKRFDAKQLGYKESFIYGSETTQSCRGCYWYDPIEFNSEISKDYIKED